jgi:hypothetical protein
MRSIALSAAFRSITAVLSRCSVDAIQTPWRTALLLFEKRSVILYELMLLLWVAQFYFQVWFNKILFHLGMFLQRFLQLLFRPI